MYTISKWIKAFLEMNGRQNTSRWGQQPPGSVTLSTPYGAVHQFNITDEVMFSSNENEIFEKPKLGEMLL